VCECGNTQLLKPVALCTQLIQQPLAKRPATDATAAAAAAAAAAAVAGCRIAPQARRRRRPRSSVSPAAPASSPAAAPSRCPPRGCPQFQAPSVSSAPPVLPHPRHRRRTPSPAGSLAHRQLSARFSRSSRVIARTSLLSGSPLQQSSLAVRTPRRRKPRAPKAKFARDSCTSEPNSSGRCLLRSQCRKLT
jgi:hypothetical protein